MIYLQKRKRFLKRFIVFTILSGFLCFFIFLLDRFTSRYFSSLHFMQNSWFLIISSAFLATVLYKPLDHLVFVLFRKVLFRRTISRMAALKHASGALIHTFDLRELANLIVNTLAEIMEQRVAALVLFDKAKNRYRIMSSYGIPLGTANKIHFKAKESLIQFLQRQKGLIQREDCLRRFSWPDVYEISKGFELLGVRAFLPIICDNTWLGFLGLSGRQSASGFSSDEAKILTDFAEESGQALTVALHVEDLKQTNEKLKDLQAKLLQTTKLAAIEQLASGIAHEIHNPLTIISGKAQILLLKKDKQYGEGMLEDALKTIVKQTKRAADITRKLLMFSEHKSSGNDMIQFEHIVDDTIALISYQTTLDEITIRKTISKDLPAFTGEINEMREVFLNLLLNAVQAVERRGTIHIYIRHFEKEGLIEIKIQDTGKGIQAEYLPRLFNPFFTMREGGLGLGLFITQQIVHRYRGSIHIESELGRGTVVLIHFPERGTVDRNEPLQPDPREIQV